MNAQTNPVATAPNKTLEQLNEELGKIDIELEEACKERNQINGVIENVKAYRADTVKQIIAAHKERAKELSSEVPRKTRADKGQKKEPTK